MLRTLLLALFLLIDLGCVSVVYSQENNDQVIDPEILSTADEVPTDVTDDTPTDLTLISSTATETIENNTNNVEFDMTSINCDINNFDYVPYSNRINVSWDDCGSNYDVDIVKAVYEGPEIPQFRRLSDSSSYQFKKLEECTAYNISIETDYGFPYRTTIRTLPDTIQNLQMLIEDDTINFNWSVPASEDCRTYQLTLNDESPQNLVENWFRTPYSTTNCTRIELGLIDNDNKTGEITTREVPGLIQKLEAEFGNHSIMATWNEPFDETCVTGYRLALNGTTIQNPTIETAYNFTGLESCTQYTVGVAAFSNSDNGKFSEVTGTTIAPTVISAVQNLRSYLSNDTLQITWNPPPLQSACITEYGLEIWGYGATVGATTTTTTYDITPAVGCRTYNVQVIPKIGQVGQGVSTTVAITIPEKINEPPTLVSVNPAKTSSTINLRLESQASNLCTITDIIVNCTAEGNEPYDWIVEDALEEDEYTDIVARTATIVVEDISEFTNYTCYAYVENAAGRSDASEAINFTTLPEVPSPPQDITYQEHENGILITWGAPAKIPGILGNYSLVISDGASVHYIPEECNVTVFDFKYETSESFFLFSKGLPSFEYSVTVSASTEVGYGEGATITMTTNHDAPEAPRNVSTELLNETGETYNVMLTVAWISPCNTNGKLSYFRWELYGESADNIDTQEKLVNANPSENDTNYEITVTNIQPFHNYTFKLAAYSGEFPEYLRGEEYVYTFISPEGFSSAPEGLIVTNITSDGAIISWGEPANKNGEILSYRISMNTTGPEHYVPPNCSVDYDTSFNYTTELTTLSYVFDKGLPNFHYIVSVAAATIAGYGVERTIEFTTGSVESQPPRDVGYELHNVLGENYNVTLDIHFLLPCNTNGKLVNFTWSLVGNSSEDFSTYTNTGIIIPNKDELDTYYVETIPNLRSLHNYQLSIAAIVGVTEQIIGEEFTTQFDSPDGLPTAPLNLTVTDLTADFGTLIWEEPKNRNGKLQNYRLILTSSGPTYNLPQGCTISYNPLVYNVTVDPEMRNYAIRGTPNFYYNATLAATTRKDYGPETTYSFTTLGAAPQEIKNIKMNITNTKTENYLSYAMISFDKPCELNGLFDHYGVEISGDRDGFMVDDHVFVIDSHAGNSFKLNLNPQHSYYGYIELYTTSFNSRVTITNFTAPAGVPPGSKLVLDPPILTPTSAALELNDQLFDSSQGDIIYYAIIVKVVADLSEELGGSYDFWELPSWPAFGSWSNSGSHTEYQTTPAFWNPFVETRSTNLTYVVGNGNCTSSDITYCNGPLKPNTQYAVRIRGFTANAYRDTDVVYFTTPSDETYLALILGLIFGILTALLLLIFIFLLWRKKRKNKEEDNEEVTVIQSSKPPPISKNKFAEHCRLFEEDRSQLKAEYSHLDRLSATEKPSSNVAMADNNKRKNRYINIMPYDDTRVKLTTDNNDNYEDYINASYIKGYSGNPEYIATQGPMGTTVEDFWKMIVQEDVGIIVMVAQFIEQSKQKCFKYFPDKEEIMHVGTDINVKCTSEANLNDYFTRTLIVEKDGEQKVIKHLQYMLWPDFGCPTNTNSMLEFREIMRKHIENTKNKAVVHCSAGVGRTGTLIAIDILLQKIDNSRDDVDVFGTVLDLRRQRTHMVQTEKQYEYIHKCLRDYLIMPKQITDDESPIYENINIINGYTDITRANGGHVSTENLIKLKEL